MQEKTYLSRVYRWLIKNAGPGTWLNAYGKEHLLPKLAVVTAVFGIARLIVGEMLRVNTDPVTSTLDTGSVPSGSDKEATIKLVNDLVSKAALPEWLLPSLVIAGLLWAAAFVFRKSYQQGYLDRDIAFKIGAAGPWVGIAVQWLFGLMLVPMALMGSIAWYSPEEVIGTEAKILLFVFSVVYIGFGTYLHRLAYDEKDIFHSVLYVIKTPRTGKAVKPADVLERFRDSLAEFMWIGSPTAGTMSEDREFILSLQVLHKAGQWKDEDAFNFGAALFDVERQLYEARCEVLHRYIPTALQEKIGEEWIERYMPSALAVSAS